MPLRLEATVHGRVQRVMYRDFVCRKARRLRLAGTVRNLKDGTVAVVAEGPQESLDVLLTQMRHGPLLARVDQIASLYTNATGQYRSFDIAYE